jgi:hypothetical protein
MAARTARKKAARKKTTARKKSAKSKSALVRIEEGLPKTLRDFGKQVRRNLDQLERDIERAIPVARKRTARIIRDASHELGRIEERGEVFWRKGVAQATKEARKMTNDAQGLLRKLERSVATAKPKKKVARKKAARKKAARAKA